MNDRSLRFEIGPIRPPSETYSLLLRFTRNCPWNKCLFCHIYKERRFGKRKLEDIKRDIDTIAAICEDIKKMSEQTGYRGRITESLVEDVFSNYLINDCYKSVAVWMYFGSRSVFIQDADSLAAGSDLFTEGLQYLKDTFPSINRVTSYARSRTIAKRLSVEDLRSMKNIGLTRLHVGLETGSDFLLKYMNKGVSKEEHIEAGKRIKDAGIELSEYIIPGLGGKKWWKEHALETADALNKINPDFIRLRTLKVLRNMPLFERIGDGDFLLPTEEDILHEERLMIDHLDGIMSRVKSDHILNLLEEVDGTLPQDKAKMLSVIDAYFELNEEQRMIYRFGRRSGIYHSINELNDELTYFRLKKTIKEMESKEPGSLEKTISLLLENYI